MEPHKFISDVLGGKARVLSFDNGVFGPNKDIILGTLSALNFARLACAAGSSTPVLSQILTLLCSREMVENALAICREWSGGIRLEVEDVYHVPLFEVPLKLVSTDYDSPSPDHIADLLEKLRHVGSLAALVITRYSDVVTCLRLQVSMQEVFVLFNPQATSDYEQVASLSFCTSLSQITQLLCAIFPLDKPRPGQANLDRQAILLGNCTGLAFVPRANCSNNAQALEESLIVSSLTLLTLKAELEELTGNNSRLKKEKQRLEKSTVDLAALLEEEKTKAKRAQFSQSSAARVTPVMPRRGPQLAQPSHSTMERRYFVDGDEETDPDIQLALQLQASFDSENNFLLEQKHALTLTAQRQYHCGVCLDDFPMDDVVHIDTCGHELCRDCARGHVCSKIEEHRFPVLCPVCMADRNNQNPGIIPGTLVQLLGVTEDQWTTWVELEIAEFSVPINCRKCHHFGFVDRSDLEMHSEIHCPFVACDHVWCRKCQQTIEAGTPNHSCDGTSELDNLVKQQGWRYCPNCKTPIQKTEGCNHLSCVSPGCNTHFCYRCGEMINRTAIPREIQEGKTAHFRSCSIFG